MIRPERFAERIFRMNGGKRLRMCANECGQGCLPTAQAMPVEPTQQEPNGSVRGLKWEDKPPVITELDPKRNVSNVEVGGCP